MHDPRDEAKGNPFDHPLERQKSVGDLPAQRSGALLRHDVERVLTAAATRAMGIDSAPMGNAQLFEADRRALRLVAQSGFTTEFTDFFRIVEDTASACGTASSTGRPVWVSDVAQSPIFAQTDSLEVILAAGSRAVASIPVASPAGQLIGMISLHHQRPIGWTEERRLELEQFCRSVGALLDGMIQSDPGER